MRASEPAGEILSERSESKEHVPGSSEPRVAQPPSAVGLHLDSAWQPGTRADAEARSVIQDRISIAEFVEKESIIGRSMLLIAEKDAIDP
jgi:hypothetical protein